MEITSADILKRLPDFEEFLTITDEISKAIVIKLTLEKEIKEGEAFVIKEVMTNPTYQINGRSPSMNLIEGTFVYTGLNGELLPKREALVQAIANLDRLRSRLDLYKEFLSMWRSLNASERISNA